MIMRMLTMTLKMVAPFMGAWIEMLAEQRHDLEAYASHPSWVRGLKSPGTHDVLEGIEGRTLHGCVD